MFDVVADPLTPEAVNVREWRRDFDRLTRLPRGLVEETAAVTSLAQLEWASARKNADFEHFQPWLERIVSLKRREAEAPVAEALPETIEPEVSAPEPETSTDRFELLAAPRGAPDDLAKLTGVGPQIVKKLNEHGVFHYWQLAAMTPEETAKLDADLRFNGRIARDRWSEQARELMAAQVEV